MLQESITRVFTMLALSKGMGQFWHAEGRTAEYTWVQNTLKTPFSRMQAAQYTLSSSHIDSMSEAMVSGEALMPAFLLHHPLCPPLRECCGLESCGLTDCHVLCVGGLHRPQPQSETCSTASIECNCLRQQQTCACTLVP